ncbi:hypothetical protein BDN70DRAFT_893413 [Pholiota conissans]|uniref:Shugoshin C-terminal domain-containing protein n=1 Tax=Pholiota conissans TaxID=109636 RepID=A0A9P5Z613_9AGAR|nr:hypothetical protein BDN70DRAFT_893413 [Pholiota conissans]
MSRRESRSSLGARQNDALFEFENFKKKFLLANKHITKLNSTLSTRIEELNAQISTLYVENLRLRASEIALAAQLKREREKSRKVLADAETASQSLAKHLSYLRESYNIKSVPSAPPSPPSPRARRREHVVDPETGSPLVNRISRPPNFPGIYEEEEPLHTSDEQQKQASPPRRKSKSKPRLSASKLPLPTRSGSPTRAATPMVGHQNMESLSAGPPTRPRKTLRRPSGLLEIDTEALSVPRSASPAFGSPIRLEAGRAEEAEEYAAVRGEIEVIIIDQDEEDTMLRKEKRKGKSKEQRESGSEKDVAGEVRVREKRKQRDEVDASDFVKPKSKDSTITRTALQPIDSNVHEAADPDPTTSKRQFLRPTSPAGSTPTSRGSSSPAPPDADGMGVGSRERRARKSVNYAEPKLNTKMRKPDPPPGTSEPARKKRSSAAAVMSSTSYKPISSSSPTAVEDDVNAEQQPSEDIFSIPPVQKLPALPLRGTNGYINPEDFPIPVQRPGSAAAMYSPGPPTRTTGSTTSGTSTSSSSSSSLKKKKSRPLTSDDDSDGAEADAEYMSSGGASAAGSWVNMEGRRRGLPKRSAATAAVAAIEDIRRHSMAI